MSVKVEKVSSPVQLGEGPHWDSKQEALYYVSISDWTIHKYTPSSGEHAKTKLDGNVGFIVPVEGTSDQFLVGLERQFQVIQWDGRDGSKASLVKTLGEVDLGTNNRINDGKADPRGRVFAGTMAIDDPPGNFQKDKGSLFRVEGTNITKVVDRIGISNGLAWDVAARAMYYTDSLERNIRRYDYEVDTGEISNLQYIFDFVKNNIEGFPDGTTIDTKGNLWVAVFNGGCVINIDPNTGKLLQKIPIPVKQVTSATFGGPNLDILFVTTAGFSVAGVTPPPPSGATFMVSGLGVKGHPNLNFKL